MLIFSTHHLGTWLLFFRLATPATPVTPIERDPLATKLWYVGEMERTVARNKLMHREDGTFLVRMSIGSTSGTKSGEYAVSLQYVEKNR